MKLFLYSLRNSVTPERNSPDESGQGVKLMYFTPEGAVSLPGRRAMEYE